MSLVVRLPTAGPRVEPECRGAAWAAGEAAGQGVRGGGGEGRWKASVTYRAQLRARGGAIGLPSASTSPLRSPHASPALCNTGGSPH